MLNISEPNLEELGLMLHGQNKELICIYDAAASYKYISPSSFSILGYEPEELQNIRLLDSLHSEDLNKNISRKDFFDQNLNSHFELRFLKKEGVWIWLQFFLQRLQNTKGEVIYYLSAKDVTNEKKSRLELERYKRLFQEVSQIAGVGGWEIDLDIEETLLTDGVLSIFDLRNEEGKSLNRLSPNSQEAQNLISSAIEYIAKSGGDYDFELPIVSGRGDKKWLRSIGRAISRESKEPILVGAFLDITESKNKQQKISGQNQELKELSASLDRQNKQLLEFSYIISHNLRGPVVNLMTLANFLNNSTDPQESELIVDQVIESTKILNDTFEELMEVLKVRDKNQIQIEELNLEESIKKALQLLKVGLNEADAEVELDFEELKIIESSKIYFESVAINFISNSIKYRDPKKYKLKIGIKSGKNSYGEYYVSFTDNGLGIDLERFGNKMFKLHKTFHRHPDGRGLGLFMSKNQIEALGGDIRVESEEGKGSKFTIVFNPTFYSDLSKEVLIEN